MCVDFTDLNKTFPKDSFPLPKIDFIVDSTTGHQILSFMDVCLGYNQVWMTLDDPDKTYFILNHRSYCYYVVPFELKNVWATY